MIRGRDQNDVSNALPKKDSLRQHRVLPSRSGMHLKDDILPWDHRGQGLHYQSFRHARERTASCEQEEIPKIPLVQLDPLANPSLELRADLLALDVRLAAQDYYGDVVGWIETRQPEYGLLARGRLAFLFAMLSPITGKRVSAGSTLITYQAGITSSSTTGCTETRYKNILLKTDLTTAVI